MRNILSMVQTINLEKLLIKASYPINYSKKLKLRKRNIFQSLTRYLKHLK